MFEPRPYGGLGHEDMRLALAWKTWSFEKRPEYKAKDQAGPHGHGQLEIIWAARAALGSM